MSTVNVSHYQRELTCAEAMARLERPAYWQAFKRGLQRAHFGEAVVDDTEHRVWLGLLTVADDGSHHEQGYGYQDGLAMGSVYPGGKDYTWPTEHSGGAR